MKIIGLRFEPKRVIFFLIMGFMSFAHAGDFGWNGLADHVDLIIGNEDNFDDWDVDGNWTGVLGYPDGSSDNAIFGVGPSAAVVVDVDRNLTAESLVFDNVNGYTISGPNKLRMHSRHQSSHLSVGADEPEEHMISVINGSHTISCEIEMETDASVDFVKAVDNSTKVLTINGDITGGKTLAVQRNVEHDRLHRLNLGGDNSFGLLKLGWGDYYDGHVKLLGGDNIPGDVVLASLASRLDLNGTSEIIGTLFHNSASGDGEIYLGGGHLIFDGTDELETSAPVSSTGGRPSAQLNRKAFAGDIKESGTITKVSTNTARFFVADSGRGALIEEAELIIDEGIVQTFDGNIFGSLVDVTINAAGKLFLTGFGENWRKLTFNGGALWVGVPLDERSEVSVDLSNGMVLNALGGTVLVSDSIDPFVMDYDISGSGDFRQSGTGTIELGGDNSFSGDYIVLDEGTVRLIKGDNFSATTLVRLNSSGTLDLNGTGEAFAGVGSTGSSAQILLGGGGFTVDHAFEIPYLGSLSESGEVTKEGLGLWDLRGNVDFTGSLDVNEGELGVNGTIPNALVTVKTGTRIRGTGQVQNMLVESGGTIRPEHSGTAEAVLDCGDLTFQGNTMLQIPYQSMGGAVSNDWGRLNIAGNLQGSATIILKPIIPATAGLDTTTAFELTVLSTQAVIPNSLGFTLDLSGVAQVFPGEFLIATNNAGKDIQIVYSLSNNVPPVLSSSPALSFPAVPKDQAPPVGVVGLAVANMVDFSSDAGGHDNVTDTLGSELGIAIEQVATNGQLYFTIDDGTNWAMVPALGTNEVFLLAEASGRRLYYQPESGFTGVVTNTVIFRAWDQVYGDEATIFDANTTEGMNTLSVNNDGINQSVLDVNTAPVLDSTVTPSLGTLPEILPAPVGPVGILISELISLSFNATDVNGDDVGIALMAGFAPIPRGALSYSLDGGSTWNLIARSQLLRNYEALLLPSTARLYFQPDADGDFPDNLLFCAWDGSSGNPGDVVDIESSGSRGGQTAYSLETDFIHLFVKKAPVATGLNTTNTYIQGQAVGLPPITITDPNDEAILTLCYTISQPALGQLVGQLSGDGSFLLSTGGIWCASGVVDTLNDYSIQFVPASSFASDFTVEIAIDDGINPTLMGTSSYTWERSPSAVLMLRNLALSTNNLSLEVDGLDRNRTYSFERFNVATGLWEDTAEIPFLPLNSCETHQLNVSEYGEWGIFRVKSF